MAAPTAVRICTRCKAEPARLGGERKPFRLCQGCFDADFLCRCGRPKAIEASTCQACYFERMKGEGHPSWKGGRTTNKEGYVKIRAVDHPRADRHGYIWEHHAVMEEAMGRYLTADENVHHINGVRDDNRLSNLELWSTSQPRGQRVEDKLAWAKAIVNKYETPAADRQGRLPVAIDFDDTLARSLWTPENPTTEIGPPIHLNIVKAREVARAGWRIVIYTARSWDDEPKIRAWLLEHQVPFDSIICAKPLCGAYVDDRARHADDASWLP